MDAFISGGWRTPQRGEVLIGGAWRRITRAEAYRGGAWRACLSFVPPLALDVTPYVEGGSNTSTARPATISTTFATATPIGGAGPYSYSWSVDGGASAITPTMASTRFRATVPAGGEVYGTATVICTDAFGSTASGQTQYSLYNRNGNLPEQ